MSSSQDWVAFYCVNSPNSRPSQIEGWDTVCLDDAGEGSRWAFMSRHNLDAMASFPAPRADSSLRFGMTISRVYGRVASPLNLPSRTRQSSAPSSRGLRGGVIVLISQMFFGSRTLAFYCVNSPNSHPSQIAGGHPLSWWCRRVRRLGQAAFTFQGPAIHEDYSNRVGGSGGR